MIKVLIKFVADKHFFCWSMKYDCRVGKLEIGMLRMNISFCSNVNFRPACEGDNK